MLEAGANIKIERSASLTTLNTLAIPATAAYCARCTSVEQLLASLDFVRQQGLLLMVLGEGSNIVFTQDYPGLVVLNRLRGIEVLAETEHNIEIKVAAGENWHQLVAHSIEQAWFGLENLALIPGLVGASPIQNIGAYGVEVKDFISAVEYLDIATGELHTLDNSQCQFAYRDSIFKRELAGKTIITSVSFNLSKSPSCNLSYPALAKQVGETAQLDELLGPKAVFDAVCKIRSDKLPSPSHIPNVGSFFKNPLVGREQYQSLLEAHPALVGFEHGDGFKLAAAWLIEQRGWKQKELNGVKVHQEQALVVTNPLRRSGQQVLALARAIQSDIDAHFSVHLEIEPRLY